ncbi:ABC transporter substrate-binding protein [Kaistia sp. 32K]|uniref:ABC transporter substrate-binding protein n=1 Tax=Kaistia sp. 32K TaxID=2795690 RepID=UPI001915A142|nr:ABC transporter substrate-binding protein [Kaistia sp. 32K]BCP55566.1 ABC transporter substrate-binding protein [Kaistia sp. 32K]
MVSRPGLSRRRLLGTALAVPFVLSGAPARAATSSRVVSLDLFATELTLTLGVTPLAVANVPLYRRLVAEPALAADTPDLGPLTEPNAELLRAMSPDAILLASWQAGSLGILSRIAPLVSVDSLSRTEPAIANAIRQIHALGELFDRTEEAEQWTQRLHATLAAAQAALTDRTARPLYVCRFAENGRNVSIFGGNGMIGDALGQLGLRNAWQGRVNASGVTSAGIDQLAGEPEARIVHFDRGAETARALAALDGSALWNALPAVRAGRVTQMPVIYPSGGIVSAIRFARQLVAGLPRHD